MDKVDYVVNPDFKLISPNLHDLEVRRIEFNSSKVTIYLAQTRRDECLLIHVIKVDRITLFSDVMQNVVYDAYVFTSEAEGNPLLGKLKKMLRLERELSAREQVLFLEPAAGIELALIGEDITFVTV